MARRSRIRAGDESRAIFDDKSFGGLGASSGKTVTQGYHRQEQETDQLLSRAAGEERLRRRRRRKAMAVRTGCEPRCR